MFFLQPMLGGVTDILGHFMFGMEVRSRNGAGVEFEYALPRGAKLD